MNGTMFIWTVGMVTALAVGVPIQLLVYWHDATGVSEALIQEPAMWCLYLFVGVLLGEHLRHWVPGQRRSSGGGP
jgi:hypothetical protein